MIINWQFNFPLQCITINLALADLPKECGGFDLSIALRILAKSKQDPLSSLSDMEFIPELSLTGVLGSVRGLLSTG